ncbi:hypothetical protein NDU88_005140 [Pleurodeles waltl]|uniref:Uncharacterized protein n=1 Tax=Pleurodeles waltl TaxID=8319 RepID=A0AAV7SKZ2_PLEWA|nr:hypothetical protein NDU88_005140 [Pleurodeles waltl]
MRGKEAVGRKVTAERGPPPPGCLCSSLCPFIVPGAPALKLLPVAVLAVDRFLLWAVVLVSPAIPLRGRDLGPPLLRLAPHQPGLSRSRCSRCHPRVTSPAAEGSRKKGRRPLTPQAADLPAHPGLRVGPGSDFSTADLGQTVLMSSQRDGSLTGEEDFGWIQGK